MHGHRLRIGLAILLLAGLSGCGGGGPTATIHGDVTVDNDPLVEGRIVYVLKDKAMEAPIKDGTYSMKDVPEGSAKVQIWYPKVVGKKAGLPGSPALEEYKETLPDRYNVQTTLKADVQAGDNTINWPLKTK
jgi:hypothetical protein